MTGAQLKAVLEQQFTDKSGVAALVPSILVPSANFQFAYDLTKPAGQRIVSMTLDGRPIDSQAGYRVTVNNFLASGGDGYSVLAEGTDAVDAGLDLDALEACLATNPAVPSGGRISGRDRALAERRLVEAAELAAVEPSPSFCSRFSASIPILSAD